MVYKFTLIASLLRFVRLFCTAVRNEATSGQEHFRPSPKRLFCLVVLGVAIPALMIWNHLGFFLDDLLFPAWKETLVHQPVFLVGNARSGTTWLHRVLHRDREHFTSATLWEILFAQSVTWRRLCFAIGRLDGAVLGGMMAALLSRADRMLLGGITVHPIGLWKAEEDEWMLAMVCCCQLLALLFPLITMFEKLIRFDEELGSEDQREIWAHFRRLMQRHLYAWGSPGGELRYLSKNPTFTLRLRSILRAFPDAHVVALVRHPAQAIPSMVSYITRCWAGVATPRSKHPFALELQGMCTEHYVYPRTVLLQADGQVAPQHAIIRYEDLRSALVPCVMGLILKLGLPRPSSNFTSALKEEADATLRFVSSHNYDICSVCGVRSRDEFDTLHAESIAAWGEAASAL